MQGILRCKIIVILSFLSLSFFSYSSSASVDPVKDDILRPLVLFVMAAESVEDALWYEGLVEYSQAAADAYNIELEQMFAGTVRPTVLSRVEARLKQDPRPDYMVFGNQRGLGVTLLELADSYEVKSFLYIAPLLEPDYERLQGPRGEIKSWIGQLIPDDEQAGYDLANLLIETARSVKVEKQDNSPISMVGITGRRSTTSSQQRYAGLQRALAEHDDVVFHQSVAARWLGEVAARKYKFLKMRYGKFDIVWSANDPMALGVVDAVKNEINPPALGGMDWIPPAIDAIRQNKMVGSMGGHNFDIAYVMVLLRHHFDGTDFADVAGTASLRSKLVPLTDDTLPQYEAFLAVKDRGDVDYRAGFAGLFEEENALNNMTMQRFINLSQLEIGTIVK